MRTGFWLFSTAGNTTIFVDSRDALPSALKESGAEQGAWLRPGGFEMAGGEFCVNACLAYAAFCVLLGRPVGRISLAGQAVAIAATGAAPRWLARAEFRMSDVKLESRDGCALCHLPGISHALIECSEFPDHGAVFEEAADLRARLGLDEKEAAGVVWHRWQGDAREIMPVVSVPKAGTCNLEGACGSGSLALAMLLPPGRHEIRQPSGESLMAASGAGAITIEASVYLKSRGELWL